MTRNLRKPDPVEFGFTAFSNLIAKREPIVGETDLPFDVFHEQLVTALEPMTALEAVIAENIVAIEWELLQHRRMRDATLRSIAARAIRDAVVGREYDMFGHETFRKCPAGVAARIAKSGLEEEAFAKEAAEEVEDDLEDEGSEEKATEEAEDHLEKDGTDDKAAEEAEGLLKHLGLEGKAADESEKQADEAAEEESEHEDFDWETEAAEKLGDDLARRIVDPDLDVRSRAEKELIELGLSPVEIMGEAYRSRERGVTDHDEKIQELERRRRQVMADYDALQKARPIEARVIEG